MLAICLLAPVAARPAPVPPSAGRYSFPERRVLLINSYHPQFRWTSRLVQGVQDAMRELIPEEHLYVEFMDGRRFVDDPDYERRLVRLYRHKYRVFRPDVIISSDDYAYNFLLRYRDEIFPGTPVVFCGVNVFEAESLRGRRGFTGILEGMEIEGNLDLIQVLHPGVRRIVLLGDQTTFGRRMTAEARRIRAARRSARNASPDPARPREGRPPPQIEILDDFTLAELRERMRTAAHDSVFLMLAIHKDRNGEYFSFEEHLPELARQTPVPIYGMWGALLIGNGVVGGMMNNPYEHGQAAAGLARRILGGEDPGLMPVIEKAVFRPYFDYRLLRRFRIPERRLPAESTVYFRPEGFYTKYRLIVNATLAFILTLVIIIALLIMNVRLRRRTEGQLKKLNTRLEERVHERTSDLNHANDELLKKNRALLELNRQKNQLVGMVAHDLRNPLGVIRGYGEFLLKDGGNLSENQRKFVRRIYGSSDFMLALVEDLLDYSRLTAGALDLRKIEVSLPDLLRNIASLNRIIAEKKRIRIEETYDANLPRVHVDPGKIEQVINNLISNAVKFSHPDTGIQIDARQRENVVLISIRDQGQGIPEGEIQGLFEPFVRASVEGTAGEKSTGLGLAIVKNIVEGHGGHIAVRSIQGQGSEFTVTLPV